MISSLPTNYSHQTGNKLPSSSSVSPLGVSASLLPRRRAERETSAVQRGAVLVNRAPVIGLLTALALVRQCSFLHQVDPALEAFVFQVLERLQCFQTIGSKLTQPAPLTRRS